MSATLIKLMAERDFGNAMNEFERQTFLTLRKAIKEAYIEGRNDGFRIAHEKESKTTKKDSNYYGGYGDGYKDGLCVAWDYARKIVLSPEDGGFNFDILREIFCGDSSVDSILRDYSISEAITKIDEYEQPIRNNQKANKDIINSTPLDKYKIKAKEET